MRVTAGRVGAVTPPAAASVVLVTVAILVRALVVGTSAAVEVVVGTTAGAVAGAAVGGVLPAFAAPLEPDPSVSFTSATAKPASERTATMATVTSSPRQRGTGASLVRAAVPQL